MSIPSRQAWRSAARQQTQWERMASVNHPKWQWARRRSVRRMLVLACALCLMLLGGTFLWADLTTAPDFVTMLVSIASMVLLGAFFGIWWLLRGPAIRGIFWLRTSDLDERQRAVRDRASRYAYGITSGLFFLGAYTWVLVNPSRFLGTMGLLMGLVMPSFWAMMALPAAVAAWIEPDDQP
jgi:hypothetical protein